MSNPYQQLDLTCKTALVTGGSRGIGKSIVQLLSARGAKVAFTYSSSKDAADALASEVDGFAIQANASDPEAAKRSVAAAAEQLGGKIDILVNNAGVFEMGPVGEYPDENFEKQVGVNVRGVWYTTSAAVEHLRDGGRIVNMGSVVGERIPFPGGSAYGMTKHAVAGFTKGWAHDLASRNITVNVVEPGPIDTEMNPDSSENPGAEGMRSMVPMGRYGKVEEVSELVAFLASPAASYISGTHITVDGGMIA
jgi:3-oxoacyl-[acyl-carrier protein] reductase